MAVIGDSHARVLMATVDRLVEQGRITADMYVMGECAWSTAPVDTSREIGRTCAHWRSNLFPLLDRKATDYDLVLTTARLVTLHGSHATQVRGLSEAWRRVTSQGVPVAVVRDNPEVRYALAEPQLLPGQGPGRAGELAVRDDPGRQPRPLVRRAERGAAPDPRHHAGRPHRPPVHGDESARC